jgi:hypothetical protein
MAGKSKFAKLKPKVRAAWEQGKKRREITREIGVPISTVNRWCAEFEADPDHVDTDPDREPAPAPKAKPVKVLSEAPPLPPGRARVVSMDDARSELRPSRFAKACKLFETIIDDRREPGAVRVQAANGLLRAAAMEAELPKHIITGSDKVSISASVEEVEARGDEQIAQDYRELLG